MRSIHCAFAAVLLSVSAASAESAPPNIYNLGTLGGPSSQATAINNVGQVTGLSEVAGASWHAFVYTGTPGSGGIMLDLGTLGGTYSSGWDINDSGQIVGESHLGTPHSRISAFLYTGAPDSGGMMHDLGTLDGISSVGINSWAYGVNDSGQIVGKSTTLPNFHEHAFLYSGTPGVDGMMHDLGFYGSAYDINNSGQIVGTNNELGFPGRAFLYTGTPGVDGMMHDLGIDGSGSDINDRGQVVGSECAFNSFPCETGHAFVYTGIPGVDGKKIDLDTWLNVNNPVEGAKWTLSHGSGINDNGLIAGQGYYDDGPGGLSDGYRAFLLDASSLLVPIDLPGDFNFDGSVDAADYSVWRDGLGTIYTQDDYDDWQANFGTTFDSGAMIRAASSIAVPEPAGFGLLMLAVPALLRCRRPA